MGNFEVNRRTFLASSGALTLAAVAGAGCADTAANKPVRLGFIGIGFRGTELLRAVLRIPNVEISALCDINEAHLQSGIDIVKEAHGFTPEGFSKGPYDYRRMLDRGDLDGIVVATPPHWHVVMCVDAMQAGKHAACEIPGVFTLQECYDLIAAKEKTGRRYMLLENHNFGRDRMMVENMVNLGVFGEPFYAESAYIHYTTPSFWEEDGKPNYKLNMIFERNDSTGYGNFYPTHSLGIISRWMGINKNDHFKNIVSTQTSCEGLYHYIKRKHGVDSELAKKKTTFGGMSVSIITTEKGRVITLFFDTTSPRPVDIYWIMQGGNGCFDSRKGIYLDGVSPDNEWDPWLKYTEKYEHEYWKTSGKRFLEMNAADVPDVFGPGAEQMELEEFVDAIRHDREPSIDVYDSVIWSSVIPLSRESVAKGSSEIPFPDFRSKKA